MNKFTRKFLSLVLGAGVTLAAAGSAIAADLKVGALFPFSGGLALLGNESYRGLELAVEERNAAGGVNGNKIVLVKADAVDANQAVGEARRLTSVEGVSAVFGSYSSALAFAATQVTELAGVPYFELGAVSDPITGRGYKYVFRSNPTAKSFAEAMLEGVRNVVAPALKVDPKTLRIAIIHEDSLYGTTIAGFQKEFAAKQGLNIVETLPYSAKTVDLSSLILRLKGSKADVVLQTSYQNDTILFFNQAKAAGYKPKAAIGAGGGYSMTDTATALGDTLNGAFSADFTQYETREDGAPGLSKFVASYQKKYGTPPRSGHSLTNYTGAKAFLDVLAAAGSTDKDKIRAAVLAYKKNPGTSPSGWGFDFGEDGQNKLAQANLMQWQNGKLMTVYPKAAAVSEPIIGK